MKVCEICKGETKELHTHHIVPQSRGGSDNKSNLVRLCLPCHSKAHDISFKSDSGVVKSAIKTAKEASKKSSKWFTDSTADKILGDIRDKDEVLYDFLVSALMLGFIGKDFFYSAGHPEYRLKSFGRVPIRKDYLDIVLTVCEGYKHEDHSS